MTRTGILIGNIFDWVKKVTRFEQVVIFFRNYYDIPLTYINCTIKTPKAQDE